MKLLQPVSIFGAIYVFLICWASQAKHAAKHFVRAYTWGEAFLAHNRSYRVTSGKVVTAIHRKRFSDSF